MALSIKVAEGVVWVSSSPLAGEISKLAMVSIASGAGLLLAKIASATLNLRDRQHTVDRLAFEAKAHLERAEELMKAGHYDLVAHWRDTGASRAFCKELFSMTAFMSQLPDLTNSFRSQQRLGLFPGNWSESSTSFE